MKKWTFDDYEALFYERSEIALEACTHTKSTANQAAFKEVLNRFKDQEQPSNAELTKFYQHMRNRND